MNKNQLNYESIENEYIDCLIRLAYRQADALDAQEAQSDGGLSPEDAELFDRAYALFRQGEKAEQHRIRSIRRKKSISRIVQIAACFVLIMGISAPIAIATVPSIRAKVLELLIDYKDGHIDVGLVVNESAAFDVPQGWKGEYYMSYIPNGFKLEQVLKRFATVSYQNMQGGWINFSELNEHQWASVDSENAEISYGTINGRMAIIVEKEGTSIIWSIDDRYFILDGTIPAEELIHIAESVRKIF